MCQTVQICTHLLSNFGQTRGRPGPGNGGGIAPRFLIKLILDILLRFLPIILYAHRNRIPLLLIGFHLGCHLLDSFISFFVPFLKHLLNFLMVLFLPLRILLFLLIQEVLNQAFLFFWSRGPGGIALSSGLMRGLILLTLLVFLNLRSVRLAVRLLLRNAYIIGNRGDFEGNFARCGGLLLGTLSLLLLRTWRHLCFLGRWRDLHLLSRRVCAIL